MGGYQKIPEEISGQMFTFTFTSVVSLPAELPARLLFTSWFCSNSSDSV
jgi:hypothetical protein